MTIALNFFKNAAEFYSFAAGETIFCESDPGDYMYGVHEGEVDIIYKGKVLNTVVVGGVFGEMALIDNSPRSADAVAKTDCKVVRLDKNHFTFLVQQHPFFALMVMQTLAARMRAMMDKC